MLFGSHLQERGPPLQNSKMLWEGKRLRDIQEADVRRIVAVKLEEHLQLEYKSALYNDTDRGRREFLLDTCMFADAAAALFSLACQSAGTKAVSRLACRIPKAFSG